MDPPAPGRYGGQGQDGGHLVAAMCLRMNAEATILAFDPGGTKCHALLVRGDGQALGWGTGEGPGLSGRSEEAFLMAACGALAHHVPKSVAVISVSDRLEPALNLGIPIRSTSRVFESE